MTHCKRWITGIPKSVGTRSNIWRQNGSECPKVDGNHKLTDVRLANPKETNMRRTSPIHSTAKFLKMCDKEETLGSNQRENYTLHTEEQRQQISY